MGLRFRSQNYKLMGVGTYGSFSVGESSRLLPSPPASPPSSSSLSKYRVLNLKNAQYLKRLGFQVFRHGGHSERGSSSTI